MKKRIMLFVLLIVILIPNLVLAQEIDDVGKVNKVVIYKNHMSESEKQAERDRQVKEHLEKLNFGKDYKIVFGDDSIRPFNDPSDYKHEYGTSKIAVAGGFAGGQGSAGYRFPTGGGFWYTDSGGPTASISVSFPKPFESVSFSVNLGEKGTTGQYVKVDPDSNNYYKLYVEKEYEVTPYVIYKWTWIDDFTGYQWVKWSAGYTKIHLGTTAYPKIVRSV
ncbi:hypothetical protein [Proteiniborus sp. MB09-C3]|uniref:hypothetical protein n=1 Tax=Proteiniborus sp. MB09-C3 TaxID=3050072 RepID=UPI00255599DE|nr:hypothetical protein [Proteiniborus sp. MB09-C3]WIV13503.1 hypothetical protein QO263_07290 [Proteiniborus sp. MB09-C3]